VSPHLRRFSLMLAAALAWVPSVATAVAPGAGVQWRFPDGQPPPFTRQELESAVDIRRPGGDGAVAVGWDDGGGGTIEASSGSRRRQVTLGDAQGPDAARLVALAVVDVLRPLPELELAAPVDRSPRPGGLPMAVAVLAALNRGATSAGFALEPSLRGGWGRGRLAVAAEVGYGQGRGRADRQTLVLHMIPARLSLQVRQGHWALQAGGLWRWYWIRGLAGGAGGAWGTLYGGHLALERSFGLTARIGALVAVGVDVHANAVDLRVRGQSLMRSGRVAPMARLGLSWGRW
jgi:hypothetical protein